MAGRDAGRIGVGRGGSDRGRGRGIDFGQIAPYPGVIVAHGGYDEEDLEDEVPLIRCRIRRSTRVQALVGGESRLG